MSFSGYSLPNSVPYFQSFPLLNYHQIQTNLKRAARTVATSTSQMALTSNSIITNPLQIVLVDTITHPLIFNCLICLSSCYLERNGYKSFTNTEIINNNNHQIRLQLNEIFLRFNLSSLKELQLIISSISINGDLNNFNIGISGSILLNFINFYDDNLTSFTFSNGLLQLIKDSPELSLQQQQQEPGPVIITSRSNIEYPSFIENLSLFSKSYYFPNYYWMCLTEFKEILEKFKRFITHDYIFPNYHLLNQFLSQVLQIVMQPNNDSSGSPPGFNDPVILKKLLQNWLIILPSNIHLLGLNHNWRQGFNDQELVLLLLFKCLGKMLDNIFPKVMFYNLHTFGTSYNFPSCNHPEQQQQQQQLFQASSSIQLQPFINYCLKVYNYFESRTNLLNNLLMNNINKISPFIKSINEIPITKFNNTVSIHPYNYLHFPQSIQLPIENLSNINEYFKHSANHNFPYTYNIHHGKHFKYCFLNNPGIQFHLFNRGLSIQNTSGSGESTDDFSFRDTIFASYYDLISKNLCKAYEELFKEFPSSAKDDQPNKRTHNNELLPTPIFVILLNENKYQEQDGQLIQWLNIFDQLRKIEFEQIPSISS